MTVHTHPRLLPQRPRLKNIDTFLPYNEAFMDHLGKLDPKALVDSLDNEGFE